MYRIIISMLLLVCSSLSLTMKRSIGYQELAGQKIRKAENGERVVGISIATKEGLYRALELVVLNNQVNSLKKLLEHEIDQSILNRSLIFACQRGFDSIVDLLLQAGADPKACTTKTRAPALIWAVQGGHTKVVSLLLQAGADKDATNEYGDTALLVAVEKGYREIISLLIDACVLVNKSTEALDTALMIATACGYKDSVEILLSAGADCDMRNLCGETALILAAINGRTEIAALLIGAGANTTNADNQGKLALQHAQEYNNRDIVHLLTMCRDSQMSVYCKNPQGYFLSCPSTAYYSILLWASICGHTDIITQILASSCAKEIINMQDEHGFTALMYALLYGHNDDALLLIRASSKEGVNTCNNQGKNALQYATAKGNLRLVGALLGAGAEASYKEVKLAADQRYLKVMGRLLFVVHDAQLPAIFK